MLRFCKLGEDGHSESSQLYRQLKQVTIPGPNDLLVIVNTWFSKIRVIHTKIASKCFLPICCQPVDMFFLQVFCIIMIITIVKKIMIDNVDISIVL